MDLWLHVDMKRGDTEPYVDIPAGSSIPSDYQHHPNAFASAALSLFFNSSSRGMAGGSPNITMQEALARSGRGQAGIRLLCVEHSV